MELPVLGLVPVSRAYWLAIGGTLAGAAWLAIVVWSHARQHQLRLAARKLVPDFFPLPEFTMERIAGTQGTATTRPKKSPKPFGSINLWAAGLGLSYLLLPLVHHLLLVPPAFRYISTSDNFFALNGSTQLASFLVAAVLAIGFTRTHRLRSPSFELDKMRGQNE
jgi:hypothetical protein